MWAWEEAFVVEVEELLMKVDEQPIYSKFKVGVLYAGPGQTTEEEMYNNECGSPAFREFLDFLGSRVRLKGFEGYKGGLDTKGDTAGKESVYTLFEEQELMFHVSTLLPFTPSNPQQLCRKRHIGNDMVTIIFQVPSLLPQPDPPSLKLRGVAGGGRGDVLTLHRPLPLPARLHHRPPRLLLRPAHLPVTSFSLTHPQRDQKAAGL